MADGPEQTGDENVLPRKDREKKLRSRKERMKKHSKGLAQMYRDSVEKRKKDA